jgi:hypothetical protein
MKELKMFNEHIIKRLTNFYYVPGQIYMCVITIFILYWVLKQIKFNVAKISRITISRIHLFWVR